MTADESAHFALIQSSISEADEVRSALEAGGAPRASSRRGPARRAEWEKAVESQMALRGQSRQHANDEVAAMVNHMVELAATERWFTNDGDLRSRAVEETVRFTARGAPVDSESAQHAWLVLWMAQTTDALVFDPHEDRAGPVGDRVRLIAARRQELHDEWRHEWRCWWDQHRGT